MSKRDQLKVFRIYSRNGEDYGPYLGRSREHALAKMFMHYGYKCKVVGDRIVFDDPDNNELCGQVENWIVGEQ